MTAQGLEPETRHSWEWREYQPRVWPSVPVSGPRRAGRAIARGFEAFTFWFSAVHIRTVCAWVLTAFTIGSGAVLIIKGGRP